MPYWCLYYWCVKIDYWKFDYDDVIIDKCCEVIHYYELMVTDTVLFHWNDGRNSIYWPYYIWLTLWWKADLILLMIIDDWLDYSSLSIIVCNYCVVLLLMTWLLLIMTDLLMTDTGNSDNSSMIILVLLRYWWSWYVIIIVCYYHWPDDLLCVWSINMY